MANTIKLGTNGNWATKEGSLLAYNDENNNFKPLPFTTTRASSATVVNKQGLIETVGSGIPRIDFSDDANGALLLEPTATNLVTYSEDFSNASWTKSELSVVDGFTSPSGTLNAKKITESGANSKHQISSTISSYTELTISFFAKKAERSFISVEKSGWGTTVFNLNDGSVVSGTGSVVDFGNGWYKCSSTYTASPAQTQFYILIMEDASTVIYQGDSTSGLYLWGVQAEHLSYATSYIKTIGTTQTRVSDTVSGSGNSTVINSTEGVLYAEISTLTELGIFRQINISKDSSNRIYVSKRADNGKLEFRMENPLGQLNFSFVQDTTTEFVKVAFRYGVNNFAVFINGVNKNVTPTGNIFTAGTLNKLSLDNGSNTQPFYGKTKSVQVYNTALSDAELISLTTI